MVSSMVTAKHFSYKKHYPQDNLLSRAEPKERAKNKKDLRGKKDKIRGKFRP